MISNQITVIGADHHNTLAVVRCLGHAGCRIRVVITGAETNLRNVHVAASKYAKGKTVIVEETESELLRWLLENKPCEEEKGIIFPCSDFSMYVVDTNGEALSKYYVMPGFIGRYGYAAEMMDKFRQKEWADEHGIKMAKTWKLLLCDGKYTVPSDVIFPCIIKPEISAFGKKTDIVISQNSESLEKALADFTEKGYQELLMQQFLIKKFETCTYGCVIEQAPHLCGGTIKKLREYPPKGGGSLCLAQFTDDVDICSLPQTVLHKLYETGYRGTFDIECLVCEDDIYLNEINFRHSGNGYALVYYGVQAPLYWCMDAVGATIPEDAVFSVENGLCHMDELNDVRHLKANGLSFGKWMKDVKKTKAFALWDRHDFSASWAFYKQTIKGAFKKLTRRGKKS